MLDVVVDLCVSVQIQVQNCNFIVTLFFKYVINGYSFMLTGKASPVSDNENDERLSLILSLAFKLAAGSESILFPTSTSSLLCLESQ